MKFYFLLVSFLLLASKPLAAQSPLMCDQNEGKLTFKCPWIKSAGGTGDCKQQSSSAGTFYTIENCSCRPPQPYTDPTPNCKQPKGSPDHQCNYSNRTIGADDRTRGKKYDTMESCTKAATAYCDYACRTYDHINSVNREYFCCRPISKADPTIR